MKITKRGLMTGVTAAALTLGIFAGNGAVARADAATLQAATSAQQTAPTQQDIDFLIGAAQESVSQLMLGMLAAERGSSDQVKQFGQQLVVDHTQALASASQLLLNAGVEPPTAPDAATQARLHELEALTGADFDAAFMRDAVMDHRENVSEMEAATTERSMEAANLANQWLPSFRSELASAEQIATGLGLDVSSF